ncbi:hypothetical protein ACQKJ1_27830 [Methylorubrum rhodesianum]|uniref:hypothetical protein n=1 Tax=Methylorubrum rhodesianum TaxID=29427 RepID=UPI003CFF8AA4
MTRLAFFELQEKAIRLVLGDFLRHSIEAVSYTVHTVLTDNGTHSTTPGNVCLGRLYGQGADRNRRDIPGSQLQVFLRPHRYRTSPDQTTFPCTDRPVEQMNRTIEDATVKLYHYDNHAQLDDFTSSYNFGRRSKALCGQTLYEARVGLTSSDASAQTRFIECRHQTSNGRAHMPVGRRTHELLI